MYKVLSIKYQEKISETGQVVLILLLVMTVALAIGLSVVQRSLTDISSSTRVEQSSRAFSAAEAGIERALQQNNLAKTDITIDQDTFGNDATADVIDSGLLPTDTKGVEYPPVSKEEIVHVWLANPYLTDLELQSTVGPYYTQPNLDVYWGTVQSRPPESQPALELTVVSFNETSKTYTNKKFLLDPTLNRVNNFIKPPCQDCDPNVADFRCSDSAGLPTTTIFSERTNDRSFLCGVRLKNLQQTLVLLRARILYSDSSEPVAVKPVVTEVACEPPNDIKNCSLPPQVRLIQSEGQSGETARTLQLFKIEKVVPFYFDYAIFSAGDINK